jgi:hypothetical protein
MLKTNLPRLKIMIIGLIAPELIIFFALRQHFMASKLEDKYKDSTYRSAPKMNFLDIYLSLEYGWTMVHGYFTIMGGFMLYNKPSHPLEDKPTIPEDDPPPILEDKPTIPEDDPPPILEDYPHILETTELDSILADHAIDITEVEISDKSKRDLLSKVIAIGQTGWFLLQCVARAVQHLPLTDLELVTLAFASLNFVIYGIWWDKPIDVQEPYPVLRKFEKGEKGSGGRPWYRWPDHIICVVFEAISYAILNPAEVIKHAAEVIKHAAKGIKDVLLAVWVAVRATILNAVPGYKAKEELFDVMVTFLKDIHLDDDMGWVSLKAVDRKAVDRKAVDRKIDLLAVPTWYAGHMGDPKGKHNSHSDIVPRAGGWAVFVATIFGGLHLIAWSFEFPSQAERRLWQVASTAITCIPLLVFVIFEFGSHKKTWWWGLLGMIALLGGIVYFLCRVALLALAFSTLRSLPQDAFKDICWADFLPHI